MVELVVLTKLALKILKKSSRNATPITKIRDYPESSKKSSKESTQARYVRESLENTHGSYISSFSAKDAFYSLLDEKFKEFVCRNGLIRFSCLPERMQLIDEFEAEINEELRQKFLYRVIDENLFTQDLVRASKN